MPRRRITVEELGFQYIFTNVDTESIPEAVMVFLAMQELGNPETDPNKLPQISILFTVGARGRTGPRLEVLAAKLDPELRWLLEGDPDRFELLMQFALLQAKEAIGEQPPPGAGGMLNGLDFPLG